MNNHGTEELRRQFEQAKSRLNDAKARHFAAREEYLAALVRDAEAEFAARGITPGTVVRAEGKRGIYVRHRAATYGARVEPDVRKINKDGTAHATASIGNPWNEEWEKEEADQ